MPGEEIAPYGYDCRHCGDKVEGVATMVEAEAALSDHLAAVHPALEEESA